MNKIKIITALTLIIGMSLISSCKDDIDAVIDCLADAAFVDLSHIMDSVDTETAILEVSYSGEHSLDTTIKWDFGDGVTKVGNKTSEKHAYSAVGTYHVKAEVTTRKGDETCIHELNETVTVN